MRRALGIALAVSFLGAVSAGAAVGTMTLDRSGTLYRVAATEDGLAVTMSAPGEDPAQVRIPQTEGIEVSQSVMAFDNRSHTVVVAWQENDKDLSRIQLATYRQGTWFGPVALTGLDGVSAANPSLLVHTAVTQLEDETTVVTTFIHLAWWAGAIDGDGEGYAMYAAIRLEDDGVPAVDEIDPVALRTLLPFGIVCGMQDNNGSLAHPKLFTDPQTGDPHALFVDTTDCMFEIVRLHEELPAQDDDTITDQRRGHVVVFGVRKDISIPPGLRLRGTQFVVGHNLSVVGYWDGEGGIDYIGMDDAGWSEVKNLRVDDTLSHEDAVGLIRQLAR